ncbi:glycine betaine ABC transporter substrate-binding protein, partial [Escherichia coli]|uniref:glycine betaine ABC transporter substrate-binding protein n=1 Tax=Escherichia coli TaxID=562 RepID=UPI00300640D0
MLTKLTRLFIVSLIAAATLSGCATASGGVESQEKIVFADAGWDSIRVHNQIARLILEKGYGKETDVINGSTTVTFVGLKEGDIDVYMEAWTNNIQKMYSEA